MTPVTDPALHATQRNTDAWTALPSWMSIPTLGALPVNAFLLKGPEPVLVDTGVNMLAEVFAARLSEEIDPRDLRWIWLSHTDADHVGALDRVLELAPNATIVTSFLGAGKLGLLGTGDPSRLRLLEPGEVFEVGGRRLHQVKPPYYDAPETMGFFDETERVYFAADAFGALLPGSVETIDQIPAETLREGLVAWSSIDAPWLAQMDQAALGRILGMLDLLEPAHLLSAHLPTAHGVSDLTRVVRDAYGRGATEAVGPNAASQLEALFG